MKKLLKNANPVKAPKNCLEVMNQENCEFVTWENNFNKDRLIARKSTVAKMVNVKFSNKTRDEKAAIEKEIDDEIVKIGNCVLTLDEARFEMDANNSNQLTVLEGFGFKNTMTRETVDLLRELLYNPNFDCELLFRK